MSRYFDLIWHLVHRDFYLRHAGSVLGILWSLFVPLAQLGVLTFTFSTIIRVEITDYPAFVFSALLPWTWFSSSLSSASHLFLSHRDLLRRPAFPPSALIIVNTISPLITFAISLPILFAIMIWNGRFVSVNPLAFALLLVFQGILTMGLSFMIATWNVFYRDIAQLVGIVLSLLFFLTPIFYRPLVTGTYRTVLELNPMVPLINSYRAILFEGTNPDLRSVTFICVISLVVCGVGYITYRRLLPDVMDAI
jgi:ABC-type polysaccharide/polyol phosphate export permease